MASAARIKKHCASLPGATFDIKWDHDECFSVGGRMFAVLGEKDGKPSLGFKVDDERFLELTDRAGIIPAPYLARARWVLVQDVRKMDEAELKPLVTRSYELIRAKLTRAVRAKLEESP
jgi:predicted DNA-binding protein (MmcQ/YjbR family)